jgi:hypothetical protein
MHLSLYYQASQIASILREIANRVWTVSTIAFDVTASRDGATLESLVARGRISIAFQASS